MSIQYITAQSFAVMAAYPGFIKKQFGVTVLLLLLVYVGVLLCSGFSNASRRPVSEKFADSLYAGSGACMKCHRAIYDSFAGTAHYLTSRGADTAFIKGSFEEGRNQFSYNQFIAVKMEQKDSGFYQTAYINGLASHSESMDIVVGSGRKGQTYLYWKENALYQLPVSYYVPAKSWCNSPGFPTAMPRFTRNVSGRCLECHGSRAVIEQSDNIDYFDKSSIVYGVDCERCHGPAATHTAFHNTHPQEKTA
jgi:nitrate/TMAO reductase-like tetraheme cytochrome c subunit